MIGNYILVFVYSYLSGTIPGAYIIGKLLGKVDVRSKGTGNLGAMNTYEVTGKAGYGVMVLLIDLLKGLLAVFITIQLFGGCFNLILVSSFAAVAGHNYNVFLKFGGGRGLATSVGCLLLVNPSIVIAWALLFLASYYLIKRHVHVGNIAATLLTTFVLMALPEDILSLLNVLAEPSKQELLLLSGALCLLIMLRHIRPMIDLARDKKST